MGSFGLLGQNLNRKDMTEELRHRNVPRPFESEIPYGMTTNHLLYALYQQLGNSERPPCRCEYCASVVKGQRCDSCGAPVRATATNAKEFQKYVRARNAPAWVVDTTCS